MQPIEMKPIARICSDFADKFGIPRQSGLIEGLKAEIVFEDEYRVPAAFKGLEGFSHLWLVWVFSESVMEKWSPTVRPPRLGGNTRMGVFATRSPFRPNPIGLSCVKLEAIDWETPKLIVSGADLMDGTPILDIKPYIPYTDSRPDALGGFSEDVKGHSLNVACENALLDALPVEKREPLLRILSQDPRPGYRHNDPSRVFGLKFAGVNVRFTVDGDDLRVIEIEPLGGNP